MKVSLLMLTYNAARFVLKSILGIKRTCDVEYELIVVDNHSRLKTRILLVILRTFGFIDKLYLNKENSLFAKGNNIASSFAAKDSTHYCLINSDIEIRDKTWLRQLCALHPQRGGISAFGACLKDPIRADGYCMLIDRELYDKYKLDENFEWWWSVTKLESQVLNDGFSIVAVRDHERFLHHFGGASGKGYINAKGMDIERDEVKKWFLARQSEVIILDKI